MSHKISWVFTSDSDDRVNEASSNNFTKQRKCHWLRAAPSSQPVLGDRLLKLYRKGCRTIGSRFESGADLNSVVCERSCSVFHSASAVSIKPGLKSNIKARGALEPQNLLFRGCQAAYPLPSFIKSPWKNCPQMCSPLSECLDVIVF